MWERIKEYANQEKWHKVKVINTSLSHIYHFSPFRFVCLLARIRACFTQKLTHATHAHTYCLAIRCSFESIILFFFNSLLFSFFFSTLSLFSFIILLLKCFIIIDENDNLIFISSASFVYVYVCAIAVDVVLFYGMLLDILILFSSEINELQCPPIGAPISQFNKILFSIATPKFSTENEIWHFWREKKLRIFAHIVFWSDQTTTCRQILRKNHS